MEANINYIGIYFKIGLSIIIILSIVTKYYQNNSKPPLACDLTNPIYRNFDEYFGIKKNYFQEVNGENSEIPLFNSIIPQDIFNKYSFILIGERGAGKTILRKKYLENKNNILVIDFFNKNVNIIFNIFISNMRSIEKNKNLTNNEIIESKWLPIYFEQSLLYIMTQRFLDMYTERIKEFKNTFNKMNSVDEKYQLFLIVNLFANQDKLVTLDNFNKDLWNSNKYIDNQDLKIRIQMEESERKIKLINSFKSLNNYMKDIWISDKINRIEIITKVINEFYISPNFKLQNDVLSIYIDFLKKYFTISPIIVIDSLDEVKFFFNEKIIYENSLRAFVKSALNHNIIAKVFDRSIDIAYFFPKVNGIDPKTFMERRDKIPMLYLDWNKNLLKNYSDYILQLMRKEQVNQCRFLPDFYELVNYKMNERFIDELKTPREINIFMQELFISLNADSEQNNFYSNSLNIAYALEKTKDRFNKSN